MSKALLLLSITLPKYKLCNFRGPKNTKAKIDEDLFEIEK